MADNRVVQGRMVTPGKLAELIEGEAVMDTEGIEDADRGCPECGGDVISVGYMPSVTEFVTGYKCHDSDSKPGKQYLVRAFIIRQRRLNRSEDENDAESVSVLRDIPRYKKGE